MINSVVSTDGAKFMTINISDFYLNTPLKRFEYVKLKMTHVPDKIKAKYYLHNKAIDGQCISRSIQQFIVYLNQVCSPMSSSKNDWKIMNTNRANSFQACGNTKPGQSNSLSLSMTLVSSTNKNKMWNT